MVSVTVIPGSGDKAVEALRRILNREYRTRAEKLKRYHEPNSKRKARKNREAQRRRSKAHSLAD